MVPEQDWSHLGKQAYTAQITRSQACYAQVEPMAATASAVSEEVFKVEVVDIQGRTARATSVSPGFTGVYSEYTQDSDGDSYWDSLVIFAEVAIDEEGDYSIGGSLWDSAGTSLENVFQAIHLTSGVHTLQLVFDGTQIHTGASEGSFELDLRLYDDNMDIIDGGINLYTTQSYSPLQFDSFVETGLFAEQAIDTNSNGLYDFLTVSSTIEVPEANAYCVSGTLTDSLGTVIATSWSLVDLDAGGNPISMPFKGTEIQKAGIDGPYSLNFCVSIGNDVVLLDSLQIYQTSAYSYTEFEGSQGALTDVYSDYGTDTDNDNSFDLLSIDVGVDITLEGDYRLTGYLRDNVGNYVEYASTEVHLTPGATTMTLDFDSFFLASSGYSGTYTLGDLYLVDTSGTALDYREEAYTTKAYDSTAFDSLEATFNGSNSDAGVDTDNDGLFNQLVIDIGVDVTVAGSYQLSGALYDAAGNYMTDIVQTGNLATGSHVLSVSVDGGVISAAEADGPYQLKYLTLRDESGLLVAVGNTYTTGEYGYLEFDAPAVHFTGTISDYLVDSDQDGVAEFLAVEYEVVASEAGSYNLNGRLSDPSGNTIVWASTVEVLSADTPTKMILQFPAADIINHCQEGVFVVDSVSVYSQADHHVQAVWRDDYQTASYAANEFVGGDSLPPIAIGGGPYAGIVGEAIQFDSSASYDPDGTIVEYRWDFNMDGACDAISTEPYAQHVWTEPFDGYIRMRVTDDAGFITYNTVKVNVTEYSAPSFQAAFDFGTLGSPVEDGYTAVTPTTVYSEALGYGWTEQTQSRTLPDNYWNIPYHVRKRLYGPLPYSQAREGIIDSRDRWTGSDLERDLNFTTDGTFLVDVPEATYEVTVMLGDAGRYVHDQVGVLLEGDLVDTVSTAKGQVKTQQYTVEVTDGQLALQLDDLGGKDPNACICALEIAAIGPVVPPLPELTIDNVTQLEGDSGTTDMVFTVNLSEASSQDVTVEYTTCDGTATAVDDYSVANGVLTIPAGQLNATIAVPVHGDTTVELDETFYVNLSNPSGAAIDQGQGVGAILGDDEPLFEAHYDFGTSRSPVASGYTQVTPSTSYSSSLAYGWLAGKIDSRDRESGGSLQQDLNFTTDGIFAVDLPNGIYDISLLLGDKGRYAHDKVGVILEGALVDTVSTAKYEVVRGEYEVEVTDGQLTLRLQDLGGADPNACIQAIDIVFKDLIEEML